MRILSAVLLFSLTSSAFSSTYFVQLGAYDKKYPAEQLIRQLEKKGISGPTISEKTVTNKRYYTVIAGPFDNQTKVHGYVTSLKKNNQPYFVFKQKSAVSKQPDSLPAINLDKSGKQVPALYQARKGGNFIGVNGGYAQQQVALGYLVPPTNPLLVRDKTYEHTSAFWGLSLIHDFESIPFRIDFKFTDILGSNQFVNNYLFNASEPKGYVNANIDINSRQYMVDLYYLLNMTPDFSIYAGGGIGLSTNSSLTTINNSPAFGNNAEYFAYTENAFAYNVEAGVSMNVYEKTSIGLFARYVALGGVVVEQHSLENKRGVGDNHAKAMLAGVNVNFRLG
ncbi:Sporulation related domain protein [Legionella moravica]|uniref:Sporulation related domain protein n=1 Tax=Legionella moravica TaxID=39962 RepID=A0A378JU37_9GAMM|nr:SPOR domain-containing protein [Legionella moravica]KTD35350.1 Sporulation related domain protein [Legionella moravica]STX61956.1 Uncharacterized protein conserved in bacteria [Legionella moravica]